MGKELGELIAKHSMGHPRAEVATGKRWMDRHPIDAEMISRSSISLHP
jgi:hypothetical protein